VRDCQRTFRFPTLITNWSNNYGPYQFPEKLIPLMINNCRNSQPLPIYGDGSNVRDWIHVSDHCEGIFRAINKGISGEVYNFGGNHELTNLEICKTIIEKLNSSEDLITFVDDRLGHDFRYAIDNSKASKKLDWKPIISFEEGIVDTIEWYISNSAWLDKITSGEYRDYYKLQYGD